jgi:hypothetical protein
MVFKINNIIPQNERVQRKTLELITRMQTIKRNCEKREKNCVRVNENNRTLRVRTYLFSAESHLSRKQVIVIYVSPLSLFHTHTYAHILRE